MKVRTLWDWSWLLTAPIAVAFLLWAGRTWDRFSEFGVRLQDANRFDLPDVGAMEFEHLVRAPLQLLHRVPPAPPDGLRSVGIHLSADARAQLDERLPQSARDYVRGYLRNGEALQRVQLRYRGDNVYHWGYYKKSWRVKTRRSELFAGMRPFNLIAPRTPELLNNHLAYLLAGELDLITPLSEPVNLFVSGRYEGIHLLTEQLEESTLRRHGRMPGDLFSGDIIGRDQPYGLVVDLFRHPGLWTKEAVNNHFPADSRAPLEALLTALADVPLREDDGLLAEHFDLEAAGRFAAMELLTATDHYDRAHNWRLLWDSWRRRFEPVVWDPIGWMAGPGTPVRLDVLTSPMHVEWHRDHDFLRARFAALRTFLVDDADRWLEAADAEIARTIATLPSDPNLTSDVAVVPADTAAAALRQLRAEIAHTFAALRANYLQGPVRLRHAAAGPGLLRLGVDGRAPLQSLVVRPAAPPTQAPRVHLRWSDERGERRVDVSARCALRDGALALDLPLLAQHVPVVATLHSANVGGRNALAIAEAVYDLEFDPPLASAAPLRVRAIWADGRETDGEAVAVLRAAPLVGARHVQRPAPIETAPVWRGRVEVQGYRVVDGDLEIAAGTELRMHPDAVLEVRGRLRAEGTAAAPIRFVPAGDRPWGALLLQGRGCDGSTLRHLVLDGGSGHLGATSESTGMLSLHDCRGITVADCRFRDNRVVDDMVHTVYCEVTFEDCAFERAHMDALDCDISEVVVRRCRFTAAGNDGVDLMETRALVDGCEFEGCGDKGMSVGEGSRLLAVECSVRGCKIGIEAKDRSIAHVLHSEFEGCTRAANAYAKNWRYGGGGVLDLARSVLAGSAEAIGADGRSRLRLIDCRLQGLDAAPERRDRHVLALHCDGGDRTLLPPEPTPPSALAELPEPAAARWREVQQQERGRAAR